MNHDERWFNDKACNPCMFTDWLEIEKIATDYHEHMNKWRTTDDLPDSDTWVVIIPEFNFCGSDSPILVHYDKKRDMFTEHGEEFPHGAIVEYQRVYLREGK